MKRKHWPAIAGGVFVIPFILFTIVLLWPAPTQVPLHEKLLETSNAIRRVTPAMFAVYDGQGLCVELEAVEDGYKLRSLVRVAPEHREGFWDLSERDRARYLAVTQYNVQEYGVTIPNFGAWYFIERTTIEIQSTASEEDLFDKLILHQQATHELITQIRNLSGVRPRNDTPQG